MRIAAFFFIACVAPAAGAQSAAFYLYLGPTAPLGPTTIQSIVRLDFGPGDSVSGWSYGVCHDPTYASLLSALPGQGTLEAQGGSQPDFISYEILDSGYSSSVIVDIEGVEALEPGYYDLSVATYEVSETTLVDLCDGLGVPVQINTSGGPVTPTTSGTT